MRVILTTLCSAMFALSAFAQSGPNLPTTLFGEAPLILPSNTRIDNGDSTRTEDNSKIVLLSIGTDRVVSTAPSGITQRAAWEIVQYSWDETIATG